MKHKKTNTGITFIEMIIVMAIFAFIAGVTLFSYRKFSDNVKVQNVMQDVALAITRAQRTAIAGAIPREASILQDVGMSWAPSYGVHISMQIPTQLLYFLDLNDDAIDNQDQDQGRYLYEDPGGLDSCDLESLSTECLDQLNFPQNYVFNGICINQPYSDLGQSDCSGGQSASWVDIVFTRPEPAPVITTDIAGPISSVTLYILETSSGTQKTVTVYATGQVQVK